MAQIDAREGGGVIAIFSILPVTASHGSALSGGRSGASPVPATTGCACVRSRGEANQIQRFRNSTAAALTMPG